MATLTVWKFDSPDAADRASETLQELAKQNLITVHDAATVSWSPDRKKPKTRQLSNTTAAGALGAAMRLIRLDHEESQLILAGLRQLMVRVVEENIEKSLQEMRAFAPFIDIMGAMHERAQIRLFVS